MQIKTVQALALLKHQGVSLSKPREVRHGIRLCTASSRESIAERLAQAGYSLTDSKSVPGDHANSDILWVSRTHPLLPPSIFNAMAFLCKLSPSETVNYEGWDCVVD
jgi:hypothetical protein